MRRAEMIAKLDMMDENRVLSVEDYRHADEKAFCGRVFPSVQDAYSPVNDPRIERLLRYEEIKPRMKKYIDYYSFTLSALLMQKKLKTPTRVQMQRMLELSGYTGEEMTKYVESSESELRACIACKSQMQTVFLIARLLKEVMEEAFRLRTEDENGAGENTDSSSSLKLKNLLLYMEKNDLLVISRASLDTYSDYIINRVRRFCIDTAKGYEEIWIKFFLDEEKEKYAKEHNEIEITLSGYPYKIEKFQRKSAAGMEKMNEALAHLDEEHMENTDYSSVAEGAIQAILEGDEIYMMGIGTHVVWEFLMQCGLAVPVFTLPPLEDEGNWKKNDPASNKEFIDLIAHGDDFIALVNEEIQSENVMIPLSTIISHYAGKVFNGNVYVRRSLVKRLTEFGCKDAAAHDIALAVAVVEQMRCFDKKEAMEYPDSDSLDMKLAEMTDKCQEYEKQVQDLKIQLALEEQRLSKKERELKLANAENKECRHRIRMLEKKNEKKEKKNEKKERTISAASEQPCSFKTFGEEDEKENTCEDTRKIQFPNHTGLKVFLAGGRKELYRNIARYLPDIQPLELNNHTDLAIVRNADIVFFQPNGIGHSESGRVIQACKKNQVPLYYLKHNGAESCAEEIIQVITRVEKASHKRNDDFAA